MCISVTQYKVLIGNWVYWTSTLITTNNYDSVTELQNPEITVTKADVKSSQSSLAVA
jgi:hypothetical protein